MFLNWVKGGSWPTKNQELLLKAALLKGVSCREAWQSWQSLVDIEALDEGSHRLLPLTYHNLTVQGIHDPLMKRLKSVYRFYLTKNHLMFHSVMPVLNTLSQKGMKVMLLKGAALNLLNYKNYALRPQLDIDALVPIVRAQEAFNYLLTIGWKPEYEFPATKIIRYKNACGFSLGPHKRLDLHWNIFHECRNEGTDTVFWDRAVPVWLKNTKLWALAPTDQLLHVCVHGVKWNTVMPCRWVADAITILNTATTPFNWKELIRQAQQRRLILPMREALQYLQKTFNAQIPAEIIRAMQEIPTSRAEQREFHIMTQKKSRVFGNLFKYTLRYARVPKPQSILGKLLDYPQYLQLCWQQRNLLLMPYRLIAESIKRNFFTK